MEKAEKALYTRKKPVIFLQEIMSMHVVTVPWVVISP
jgi:hypothetical protein